MNLPLECREQEQGEISWRGGVQEGSAALPGPRVPSVLGCSAPGTLEGTQALQAMARKVGTRGKSP